MLNAVVTFGKLYGICGHYNKVLFCLLRSNNGQIILIIVVLEIHFIAGKNMRMLKTSKATYTIVILK